MKHPQDQYQVEYAAIEWIEVLGEGVWNEFPYDREFLETISESYDPNVIRAKLITDHAWRGPAFGHILELKVEDDPTDAGRYRLMALTGFLEEGKQMVESGNYNERSVGWSSWYPTSGIPYLWEVSLLGANTPASAGMEPIIFDKDIEDDDLTERVAPVVFSDEIAQDMAQIDLDETIQLAEKPELLHLLEIKKLVWDQTDNYIRYRMRQQSRFQDRSFRTVALSDEKGVWSVQGKLKAKYVPEGHDPTSMVIQSILFSREDKHNWTLKRAKSWVKSHKDDLAAGHTEGEGHVLVLDEDGALVSVPEGEATILEDETSAEPTGGGVVTLVETPTKGGQIMPDPDPALKGGEDKKAGDGDNEIKAPALQVVQSDSAEALALQNEKLRQQLEQLNSQAVTAEKAHNEALKAQKASTRLSIVNAKVNTLLSDGYITLAQVNYGLVEALMHVPEDATVQIGKAKIDAVDAIIESLKYGGQLKLKHDFSKELTAEESDESPDADLDRLEAAGHTVTSERIKRRLAKEHEDWSLMKLQTEAMKAVQRGEES